MLVFEDSENGCKAAVASGAITVAVPSGHSLGMLFRCGIIASSLADPHIYELLDSRTNRKSADKADLLFFSLPVGSGFITFNWS